MNFIFVTLFYIVPLTSSLQNVRIIFPESVAEGGIATLLCLYDLEGEPLYSVKWYRGTYEIFRFLPRENPRISIFPLPGLYIDLNSSNAHRLILLDIPKRLGGNFTCEVTTDAPNYTTRYITQALQVVRNVSEMYEMPNEKYTKLIINKGDVMNLNVTSGTIEMYKIYCSIYLYSIIILILLIVK